MSVCLDNALLGAAGAATAIGIEKLAELIKTAIKTTRKPANSLPPFYTTIEGMMRPGLSAISLTANEISRLGEAGIDTSTLPNGEEPLMMKFIRIQNEETIKELQLNMKTDVEIPPGAPIGMAGTVPVIATVPIKGNAINY